MTPVEELEITEKRLLVDGEWIVSDAWDEVRSPYSGEVVGRVPRVGAEVTRQALSAAEVALRTPLPA
jgi:succinate-semialdehyde dehydrogenase/glutarate-semialdehyde dehydrogenase